MLDVARPLPRWSRPFYVLSHPIAILPIATVIGAYFSSYPPRHINAFDVPLFLQGNTDWGGSNIFAATIALYATFGILAAVYAILDMHIREATASYVPRVRTTLWTLRFHIVLFILGGRAFWDYDSLVTPNDFRNMFLFALFVYGISVAIVTALGRARLTLASRLALAPVTIFVWLWLGADGNTMKAGQTRQSGEDPAFHPRGVRHRVMLAWHQACDRLLGDR